MQKPKSRDINQMAAAILAAAIGTPEEPKPKRKNPAAVALGRAGGLKGGKARAKALIDYVVGVFTDDTGAFSADRIHRPFLESEHFLIKFVREPLGPCSQFFS